MKKLQFISLIILTSCGVSDLAIPDENGVLVVEGWITNENKQHWVNLSRTVPFDESRSSDPINDAIVHIEDNVSSFPLSSSGKGTYLSMPFAGIEARSYRVTIELANGEIIQSEWERLNPLMPIDTIRYKFFTDQDPETGENVRVYFPIVVSSDPVDESNFYRYKGFRNGLPLNEPNEIILLSDQFVNGANSLPNFIPEFRYSFADTIKVELHSLSQNGFEFLELLKSQTTSLGSSSGISPASLIGNLTNSENNGQTVLGFFGASAVSTKTNIIDQ